MMNPAEDVGKNVFVISEGRNRRQLVNHAVYKGVKSSRTFHQRRIGGAWINSDMLPKVGEARRK